MLWLNHYVIDWGKVQTLDDMKRLISALNISFDPIDSKVEGIKDLVRLEVKPDVGYGPL